MRPYDEDKPAFEASFKMGMGADLGVSAGDISISEIKVWRVEPMCRLSVC